jgi:hypothetical protein
MGVAGRSRSTTIVCCLSPQSFRRASAAALRDLWRHVPPSDDLVMMTQWLTSVELATLLVPFVDPQWEGDVPTRYETLDISPLLQNGTVESSSVGRCRLSARIFRVPKSDNTFSRFIFDGRRFDEIFHSALGDPPPMPLPSITDVIDGILSGWSVISSIDAKSMFFQFSIHPSLREVFTFRLGGRRGNFRRLRLAACFAPTWAQHVSAYLISVLQRRNSFHKFRMFAWIDNFILVTKSACDYSMIS